MKNLMVYTILFILFSCQKITKESKIEIRTDSSNNSSLNNNNLDTIIKSKDDFYIYNEDSLKKYQKIETSNIKDYDKYKYLDCNSLIDSTGYLINFYSEEVERKLKNAENYIKIALKNNCADAFLILGSMYIYEKDLTIKYKGYLYLEKSIQLGSVIGINSLANYYIKIDKYEEAISLYNKGYNKGSLYSGYILAYLYYYGNFSPLGDVKKREYKKMMDKPKGEKMMKHIADKGYDMAQLEMVYILKNINKNEAFNYLIKAFKQFWKSFNDGQAAKCEELLENDFKELWIEYQKEHPNEF